MAGKNTKSQVWKHFEKEDETNIKCNLCSSIVKVKDGSTTNLHNHLKRKHDIAVTTCLPKKAKEKSGDDDHDVVCLTSTSKQQSLVNAWTKLPFASVRSTKITKAVAKFILLDMRPLSTVNDEGFQQLIKVLEPRYDLSSRTYITETLIPRMYEQTVELVKKDLEDAEFIALTTDGWTSRAAVSFNTVTAHLISSDWKLKDFVLSTSAMEEQHTGENLAAQFKDVAKEWGINLSDTAVTTDNAQNVVLAMEKCQLLCHVRCMAHILNLSTQKGLKVPGLQRLLGRVRSVVGFFHRSPTASSILNKTLVQLEIPTLRPIMDVSTRWNSTYDMLERYVNIVMFSNQIM